MSRRRRNKCNYTKTVSSKRIERKRSQRQSELMLRLNEDEHVAFFRTVIQGWQIPISYFAQFEGNDDG